jgi:hypothetical protein
MERWFQLLTSFPLTRKFVNQRRHNIIRDVPHELLDGPERLTE